MGGSNPQLIDGNVYGSNPNIVLTGHSLGGGLAGLMGALYGQQAVVFDNMRFETAATTIYNDATRPTDNGMPNDNHPAALASYYGTSPVRPLNYSGISGYQLDGQFLQPWSTGVVVGNGYVPQMNPFNMNHSMSLLVLTMYAEDPTNVAGSGWKDTIGSLYPQLFNNSIAEAIGFTFGGLGSLSEKMRDMIAYSVLDGGVMPFGNAAAHSLFDDANDIATLFSSYSNNLAAFGTEQGDLTELGLSQIAVQFAGTQAAYAVLANGVSQFGVIADSSNGLLVSVDSDAAARHAPKSVVGMSSIASLAGVLATGGSGLMPAVASAILDEVDFLLFGKGGEASVDLAASFLTSGDRLSNPATAGALVIGTTAEDQVTGGAGNDVIITGAGTDTLTGGEGNDALFAGLEGEEDTDILNGEAGNDLLYAGGGLDTVIGGDGGDSLFGGSGSDVLIVGNIDGSSGTTGDNEIIDGGAEEDYLILTSGMGSTVTVQGNHPEDRLLIHSSLLGENAPGGEGDYPLFLLSGGVFLVTATAFENTFEGVVGGNVNANFLDDAVDPVRVWYYSTQPFNTPTFVTTSNGMIQRQHPTH
jgi:hypothetical protein